MRYCRAEPGQLGPLPNPCSALTTSRNPRSGILSRRRIGDSGNAASIALHHGLRFVMVGTLRSAGYKFGRWADVVLMQRALGDADRIAPP
jgi:hypothetical protein